MKMKLLGFKKSTRKNKKYTAFVKDGDKIFKVHFGDARYEHYKDTTGVGAWSHKDHLDEKRRKNYRRRHEAQGFHSVLYSPSYFAYNYLW